MPNCGGSCSCSLKVGAGLTLSGSGSLDNPFRIEVDGGFQDTFTVEDSPTVDLRLNGAGTVLDPFRLTAEASVSMSQLSDVNDPEGSPASGDTVVWVTDAGDPHWEFRAPPPNPAGAVNVGSGIVGDGTLGAPIRPALLGTSAGGATTGLEVYVDSAGVLRAVAPVVADVEWDSILERPATFPTTPGDFTGILPVSKGGTGQDDLADVTVGNSTKIDGRRIYVQSGTPSGTIPLNSLWFW
jgi:hypothetical protein